MRQVDCERGILRTNCWSWLRPDWQILLANHLWNWQQEHLKYEKFVELCLHFNSFHFDEFFNLKISGKTLFILDLYPVRNSFRFIAF